MFDENDFFHTNAKRMPLKQKVIQMPLLFILDYIHGEGAKQMQS